MTNAPLRSTHTNLTESLYYEPNWWPESDALLSWFQQHGAWQQETIKMFGKSIVVPRKVAWHGDQGASYRYSGLDHQADGWPDVLVSLAQAIGSIVHQRINFVLVNCYEHGGHYMGWHRDDEPQLSAPVASLTLGSTRRFLLEQVAGDGTTRRTEWQLKHGDLLVHPGSWRHCLPKTQKAVGQRINLSFRVVS